MMFTADAQLFHGTDETTASSDMYLVAQDLMVRANSAKEHGDTASATRLLRAALDIMAEDTPAIRGRQPSPETTIVVELLKTGWYEAAAISDQTGVSINRVNLVLGRLRKRGAGLEVSTAKRYRIVQKS